MCTQRTPKNYTKDIYERFCKAIRDYYDKVLGRLRNEKEGVLLLKGVGRCWTQHKLLVRSLQKIFGYVDRYYCEHQNVPKCELVAKASFKSKVYAGTDTHPGIRRQLTPALLAVINADRDGEQVDKALLHNVIRLFGDLEDDKEGLYARDFEVFLLAGAREYYGRKGDALLSSDSVPTYLEKAEAYVASEEERVAAYMQPSTLEPLLRVVTDVLLVQQQDRLLTNEVSGFKAMLVDEKLEDMGRLFRLYSRVHDRLAAVGDPRNVLQPIARIMQDYLVSLGTNICREREAALPEREAGAGSGGGGAGAGAPAAAQVGGMLLAPDSKDSAENPAFIKALLALHEKARSLVAAQFSSSPVFQKALKDSFDNFLNKSPARSKISTCEILANYTDHVLTAKDKLKDEELELELERIVHLFQYVGEKDLFVEVYRTLLSKRLLGGKAQSNDLERSMISKLKLACGAQFTNKLEGMMNDLVGQEKLDKEFSDHQAEQPTRLTLDFTVQVLTQGWWPSTITMPIVLPPLMLACTMRYEDFYAKSKSKSRTLQWSHTQGTVAVRANYASGKSYEFALNTLQCVVVMLFNDAVTAVNVEAITAKIGTANAEVTKRILHSLACGKYKILKKTPEGASIKDDHTFAYNPAFSNQMHKIRVPMPSLAASHNPKKLEEDRSQVIDACIVRIMKARKQLSHAELVGQVLTHVRCCGARPSLALGRAALLLPSPLALSRLHAQSPSAPPPLPPMRSLIS